MILIISENHDSQTDMVMDWLQFEYQQEVVRINDDDWVLIRQLLMDKGHSTFELLVNTCTGKRIIINSTSIGATWYRRGDFSIYNKIDVPKEEFRQYSEELWKHVKGSNDVVKEFLHRYFADKQVGSYYDNLTNKLLNLDLMRSLGFEIPPTLVTSNKSDLGSFIELHQKVITKGLSTNGFQVDRQYSFSCLTSFITEADYQKIPDFFAPSLFQKVVDKVLELRVFYINSKCYSVAMMTQSNERTMLDFRNYDTTKPTRMVPFILPATLQRGIQRFMSSINMTSGSLDFIYSKDGKYYFLEVNPVGQFGFISNWCNATLESVIANELIKIGYDKCG